MTKVSLAGTIADAATGAFWRFSLALYDRPGVAAACLELQDRHGRDVNLALYAVWVGASGRGRLSATDLDAVKAALAPWHGTVIAPLRALRRRAKDETDAPALYAALKAAELEAEHVAQDRLERLAPPAAALHAAPLEDAVANLAAYLGFGAALEAAAPLLRALVDGAAEA
jgi:uncharacterized protein (TIGR02444 family)